jgi:translocation and assembly module TamB
LTLTSANIRLDEDRWALLQPSTLTYDEAFRIRNLLLFTDDQQIAVDGIVDLDGDQSLILTIENFRIGSVADMLGYAGLDGAMNGYLDLVGPAEAPVIQGDLNVDLESNRRTVGDLQIAVRYDSLQLRTSGFLNHEDGGSMVFDGLVPVDLRLAGEGEQPLRVSAADATPDSDVDLTIEADSFSMGWLLPFLDPAVYSKLSGIVDVELAMRGTFAEPLMTGTATIRDGTIGLPTFGIEVTKLNGGFLFEDRFIRISNLRGESGRGHVVAVGSIELANLALGEFDISLDLEQFLAIDNSDYRASTAGDLLLYGTTRAPVVSGSLRLESLDLYYKGTIDEFEPVTLTERDLRQVEIVFGRRITAADTTTYDFFTALEIDVNLEMTRDSWLRSTQNPRMDVPFFGSLDVSKEPNESLQLFGTIDIVENRGRIVELGRRFDINRGTITYNGPLSDPRIDLEATYTVQTRGVGGQTEENIQISLLAQGSLQDLDLTLTSDPQMETTDILSYILVGRPARESLQFGGGEESFAADIALSQAAGFLEGLAGEELGLDVVRIEYEGTEIKLTAGKYLRPGIYVAISQPIVLNSGSTQTAGSTQSDRGLLVEVELVRGLLARLQQQGSVFGINLFWLYAY